jgi:hypothetical protein
MNNSDKWKPKAKRSYAHPRIQIFGILWEYIAPWLSYQLGAIRFRLGALDGLQIPPDTKLDNTMVNWLIARKRAIENGTRHPDLWEVDYQIQRRKHKIPLVALQAIHEFMCKKQGVTQ